MLLGKERHDERMTQGPKLWQRERKKAFFLALIKRELKLDDKASDRLADALTKAVIDLRVWKMPEMPARLVTGPVSSASKDSPSGAKEPASLVEKTAASSKPEQPAFDPYAFSAIVVLSKTGKDGLAKRLAEIKGADNLRKFAEAQHLGIDRGLTKVEDLRKAILAAAEQRLADRRAAAS